MVTGASERAIDLGNQRLGQDDWLPCSIAARPYSRVLYLSNPVARMRPSHLQIVQWDAVDGRNMLTTRSKIADGF